MSEISGFFSRFIFSWKLDIIGNLNKYVDWKKWIAWDDLKYYILEYNEKWQNKLCVICDMITTLRACTFTHCSDAFFKNVSVAIKNLDHYVISVLKAEIPICRAVVSGGAKGALAPPEFRSSVIPIPTRGGRLRPPHYY